MHPLLTFLIPTYKRPHNVIRVVRSILSQCNSTNEGEVFIVVNDDATPGLDIKTLEHAIKKEPNKARVTISQNKNNLGMSANIYQMVKKVKSSYWTVLTDDDELEDGSLHAILSVTEFARETRLGSIISTRYCYDDNGNYLFKSCNPFRTYQSTIQCGPIRSLLYMRNGHILTGMIMSSETSLSEWRDNIENAYFPLIYFGVSLISADCLYVDQPWFRHTVGNKTFWERWGETEEARQLRLFSDFWGAYIVVKNIALDRSSPTERLAIIITFYYVLVDFISRSVRAFGIINVLHSLVSSTMSRTPVSKASRVLIFMIALIHHSTLHVIDRSKSLLRSF